MATVHVTNISHTSTEKTVRDFFAFCGHITDISVTPASSAPDSPLSATITFERETAAKTALLLSGTSLDGSPVQVESSSSLDDLSKSAGETAHQDDELRQEDKPRTAVLAEYLSQGYVIGDKALQRGIELDEKHGFTTKFTNYLNNLENRFKATDKARAVDSTYGVTTKANSGYNTITRYFESALSTPTGQKVREFYTKSQKQVMDIHAEARRLADLKADKTKCTCGGEGGKCNCPDGKCSCSGCSKRNTSSSEKSDPAVQTGTAGAAGTSTTSEKFA